VKSVNKTFANLSTSSSKALDLKTNIDEYFAEDADLFSMLFNKDSSEVDLFLNTLNSFAQNKNKLVELLRSLSTIKKESSNNNSYDSLLSSDSLKFFQSGVSRDNNKPSHEEDLGQVKLNLTNSDVKLCL
jgi:thiamine biosynthesis lipoprotein ApbE